MDDELYADEDYKKAASRHPSPVRAVPGRAARPAAPRPAATAGLDGPGLWRRCVAINDVLGEEQNDVILKGKVVKVEFRELKSKRILLTFQMADSTNGISAKKFLDVSNQGGAASSAARTR